MNPLLCVDNLSVTYRKPRLMRAVSDVSFELYRQDILGVIGESGSGKTTLAYALLHLLPPEADVHGRVELKGVDVSSFDERAWRTLRAKTVGIILQDPRASFNPVLTIRYQFQEFLKQKRIGSTRAQRLRIIEESLARVHLDVPERILDSYPYQLSGGQLQRAMIGLVIAAGPEIIIADEPTSSLDVTVESQLIYTFRELCDELHMTMVFITHNIGIVKVLCDKVIVLHAGKICEAGRVDKVIVEPKEPYTKELIASFDALGG